MMQLYPKLADGTVDKTDTIMLGHGQKHGTLQTWEDTGANGMQNADTHMIVKAKIKFVDYLKAYSGVFDTSPPLFREGHTGFMLRAVIEDIPKTHYKGHGPIFCSGMWCGAEEPWDANNPTPRMRRQRKIAQTPSGPMEMPCAMLESWGKPIVPPHFGFIRKNSNSPPLEDHVSYDFMSISTVFCGSIYNSYYLGRLDHASAQYDRLFSTRDMEDNNWGMDRWRQGLALFDASSSSLRDPAFPDARMEVERLSVTWKAATSVNV